MVFKQTEGLANPPIQGNYKYFHYLNDYLLLVWVLWGNTLSFGPDKGGLIGGLDYLGFNGVGGEAAFGTYTIPHYTFAIFQCAFAAITVAIISGRIAGRISFPAWILFSLLWITFIYALMAHWVWGDGFLAKLGELDFAGGSSKTICASTCYPRRRINGIGY